ncbi:hypothetical protein BC831DRAFT_462789, partial [Entophlyctis helioformis]
LTNQLNSLKKHKDVLRIVEVWDGRSEYDRNLIMALVENLCSKERRVSPIALQFIKMLLRAHRGRGRQPKGVYTEEIERFHTYLNLLPGGRRILAFLGANFVMPSPKTIKNWTAGMEGQSVEPTVATLQAIAAQIQDTQKRQGLESVQVPYTLALDEVHVNTWRWVESQIVGDRVQVLYAANNNYDVLTGEGTVQQTERVSAFLDCACWLWKMHQSLTFNPSYSQRS